MKPEGIIAERLKQGLRAELKLLSMLPLQILSATEGGYFFLESDESLYSHSAADGIVVLTSEIFAALCEIKV